MRQKLLYFGAVIILIIAQNICFSQATWTQKANCFTTYRAVGFSIGSKGYIGTGLYYVDFWEWDQSTNVWTQKANFGGSGRDWATGFSIGNKGYIGTGGYDGDFWEWNQANNIWSKKANYRGQIAVIDSNGNPSQIEWVVGAIGFSIGNKGYIGTGNYGGTYYNDFWEWDQATDTWTQRTNFPAQGRLGAVGFSIGSKGYIGTGNDGNGNWFNDFWEWDQSTDTWSQKANLPANGRYSAFGFAIGAKGYIGTGISGSNFLNDFWEWDQATNTWAQKPDFAGGKRCRAVGFSIGNKGYVGTGSDSTNTPTNDFWEYDPNCSVSPVSICMITVDNNNRNVVLWEKPSIGQPIDSFRIYREVSSIFKHIGSVPFSALSEFTDMTTGVNPNITSYRYKIAVKDSCGNETILSSFHKTIHLALSPASPCGYNLIWNDYLGFTLNQYLIYRDSAKTGWKVVDSLSFGNTSWTDATCYSSTDTVAYFIEAVAPVSCVSTIKSPLPIYSSTHSNTQQNFASPSNIREMDQEIFFQLLPNPFYSETTLQFNKNLLDAEIFIINTLGQTSKHIKNVSGHSIKLHRDNLPSGLYFIRVTQNKKVLSTDKLIISD